MVRSKIHRRNNFLPHLSGILLGLQPLTGGKDLVFFCVASHSARRLPTPLQTTTTTSQSTDDSDWGISWNPALISYTYCRAECTKGVGLSFMTCPGAPPRFVKPLALLQSTKCRMSLSSHRESATRRFLVAECKTDSAQPKLTSTASPFSSATYMASRRTARTLRTKYK